MNRDPCTKKHCRKATPYDTQQASTMVKVIARCRCAFIVRGWDRAGPRREEVDEEEKHRKLAP